MPNLFAEKKTFHWLTFKRPITGVYKQEGHDGPELLTSGSWLSVYF